MRSWVMSSRSRRKSQDLVPEDELGLVGIDIRDGMPGAVIEEEHDSRVRTGERLRHRDPRQRDGSTARVARWRLGLRENGRGPEFSAPDKFVTIAAQRFQCSGCSSSELRFISLANPIWLEFSTPALETLSPSSGPEAAELQKYLRRYVVG